MAVEYDNIINLLQGLLGISKALVPIVELLPAEHTIVVGAEAGAHLGSAIIGGLPKNIKFKKIFGEVSKIVLEISILFLKFY